MTAALLVCRLPALTRYVRRLVGERDLADDIVQEVFLRALAGQGPRVPEHVLAWSIGVARHVAGAEWRRRRRWLSQEMHHDLWENLRDPKSTPEQVIAARSALARMLDEDRRAALLFKRHEGAFDPGTLAVELGLSPAALRMQLLRLRRSAHSRQGP